MLARWFQFSVGKMVPVKCWQGGSSMALVRWFLFSVGKMVSVPCHTKYFWQKLTNYSRTVIKCFPILENLV